MRFLETWKKLIIVLKPVRRAYLLGLFFVLLSTGVGVMVPKGIGEVFQLIAHQDQSGNLPWRPLLLFVLILNSFFLLRFVAQWRFNGLRHAISRDLTLQLFRRYYVMPRSSRIHKSIESYQHTLFNDVGALASYLTLVLPKALTRFGLMLGAFVALFLLSWKLSIALGVLIGFTVMLFTRTQKSIKEMIHTVEKQRLSYRAETHSLLRNIDTLRAMNCQSFGERILQDREAELQKSMRRTQLLNEAWSTGLLATLSIYFLLFAIGLCLMIKMGYCDAPWASQYFTYLGMLLINTLNSSTTMQAFLNLQKSMERIQNFDAAGEKAQDANIPLLPVGESEWVGIVGPSGVGKTTALRYFLQLDAPPTQRSLGYLDQDIPIFPVSLRDNIFIGRNFDDAELKAALDVACISQEFYEPYLDAGTILNDKVLSGGEKLRIGLARALIGSPQTVVLDEPSAALDEGTELRLLGKLRSFLNESSRLIVVTHSPKVMQAMDRLISMERPS